MEVKVARMPSPVYVTAGLPVRVNHGPPRRTTELAMAIFGPGPGPDARMAPMYYGGDVVEIALAVVVAATWYAASGRALAQAARRAAGPHRGRVIEARQGTG